MRTLRALRRDTKKELKNRSAQYEKKANISAIIELLQFLQIQHSTHLVRYSQVGANSNWPILAPNLPIGLSPHSLPKC